MGSYPGYDRMTCEVKITRGDGSVIRFYQCVSIEIETSFDTLTDTAVITLPYDNRLNFKDANGYNQYRMVSGNAEGMISIGDILEINYGYNFDNKLEFSGYITEVEPSRPLKLICQDKSWRLKKNRLLIPAKFNVHLKDIISELVEGTGVEVHPQTFESDIVFGKLEARNISTAKLLEEWRNRGIRAFMKDGMLCIGRSYFSSSAGVYSSTLIKGYEPSVFNTCRNIIEEDLRLVSLINERPLQRSKPRNTQDSVVYGDPCRRNKYNLEASGVAIQAVSMGTDNKSLEITLVMDPKDPSKLIIVAERDERLTDAQNETKQKKLTAQAEAKGIFLENYFIKTVHWYSTDREQLIEGAKGVFPKYFKSGLSGSFTTFGHISLKPATSIYFEDPRDASREGEYLIQSISKSWSAGGIRQKVYIPHKIRGL